MTENLKLESILELNAGSELTERWGGTLWRVRSGMLGWSVPAAASTGSVLGLMRRGDWVNADLMADLPGTRTAVAMTPCVLEGLRPDVLAPQVRQEVLRQCLEQQLRMATEMGGLRSGPVQERLRGLLMMLDDPSVDEVPHWPSLKAMGTIVDTTPETVCRVIGQFRRLNLVHERRPQRARICASELAAVDLPRGMSSSAARHARAPVETRAGVN